MKLSKKVLISLIVSIFLITPSPAWSWKLWGWWKKKPVVNLLEQIPDEQPPSLEYYNEVPETIKFNIYDIEKKKEIVSMAAISPDFSKATYTEEYLYSQNNQKASRAFYINAKASNKNNQQNPRDPINLAGMFKLKDRNNPPIYLMESDFNRTDDEGVRVLTVIDWSIDSKKILLKETISEHLRGIWETNLWVYDLEQKKAIDLNVLRRSIIYYWKHLQKLDLDYYRWDIAPRGWSIDNDEQIIANVYGYHNDEKKFLGCWSVDYKGDNTQLLSLVNDKWPVAKYGYVLKENNDFKNPAQ